MKLWIFFFYIQLSTALTAKQCNVFRQEYRALPNEVSRKLLREKGCFDIKEEKEKFGNQRQVKDEQERKQKEAEALQYFAKLDKNSDGYITKDELIFEVVLDQNNDGQVSDEEVNSRHENYDKETFVCSKEEIQKMIKHELRNKDEKSSRSVSTIISDLSSIIGQIFGLTFILIIGKTFYYIQDVQTSFGLKAISENLKAARN